MTAQKQRDSRYHKPAYIYAGLFLAFQVSGYLNGSKLHVALQLFLVFATLGATPFLLRTGAEYLQSINPKKLSKN